MFAAGAKMMSTQFEIFRNVLEESIRRVSVRVTWKEGTRERYVSVVGYFTDPRKIGIAGVLPSAPTPGAEGADARSGDQATSPTRTPGRNIPSPKTFNPSLLPPSRGGAR
jgi:hypothetical protein